MGKMSELDMVIKDLRRVAEAINSAADTLTEMFAGKQYTIEEVRALLAEIARVSFANTNAVKALLIKHGADRLKQIAPSEYSALVAEASKLPSKEDATDDS